MILGMLLGIGKEEAMDKWLAELCITLAAWVDENNLHDYEKEVMV